MFVRDLVGRWHFEEDDSSDILCGATIVETRRSRPVDFRLSHGEDVCPFCWNILSDRARKEEEPDALTEDQRVLVEMVRDWRANNHDLRFGQWLWALDEDMTSDDFFHIEDEELACRMERWFEAHGAEVDGFPQDPPGGTSLPQGGGQMITVAGFEFHDAPPLSDEDADASGQIGEILQKVWHTGFCRVILDDGPVSYLVSTFLHAVAGEHFDVFDKNYQLVVVSHDHDAHFEVKAV